MNYCRSCNTQISPGAGFCRQCGTPAVTQSQVVMHSSAPQGDTMGNLLASGSGKGHPGIFSGWVFILIWAALSIFLIVVMANLVSHLQIRQMWNGRWDIRLGSTRDDDIYYIIMFIGIVGSLIGFPIAAIRLHLSFLKNEVFVFEGGIRGFGDIFDGSDVLKGAAFSLVYSQLTSVDLENRAVVINANGRRYHVFVKNAPEIMNYINLMLHQRHNQLKGAHFGYQ